MVFLAKFSIFLKKLKTELYDIERLITYIHIHIHKKTVNANCWLTLRIYILFCKQYKNQQEFFAYTCIGKVSNKQLKQQQLTTISINCKRKFSLNHHISVNYLNICIAYGSYLFWIFAKQTPSPYMHTYIVCGVCIVSCVLSLYITKLLFPSVTTICYLRSSRTDKDRIEGVGGCHLMELYEKKKKKKNEKFQIP